LLYSGSETDELDRRLVFEFAFPEALLFRRWRLDEVADSELEDDEDSSLVDEESDPVDEVLEVEDELLTPWNTYKEDKSFLLKLSPV